MATIISVTQTVKITDGGSVVIDEQHSLSDFEADIHLPIPLHLPPGASVELDVASSPLISAWASIVGFAGEVKAPGYCVMTVLAAGTVPLLVGPGPFAVSRTEASYVKFTNTSAVTVEGIIILYGRLS